MNEDLAVLKGKLAISRFLSDQEELDDLGYSYIANHVNIAMFAVMYASLHVNDREVFREKLKVIMDTISDEVFEDMEDLIEIFTREEDE